jgi:hypothetical protein
MSPASFPFAKVDPASSRRISADDAIDSPSVPFQFWQSLRKPLDFNELRKHLQ